MALSQLPAIKLPAGVRYFAAIFLATFFFFFTRQEITSSQSTAPQPTNTKSTNKPSTNTKTER